MVLQTAITWWKTICQMRTRTRLFDQFMSAENENMTLVKEQFMLYMDELLEENLDFGFKFQHNIWTDTELGHINRSTSRAIKAADKEKSKMEAAQLDMP
uniref:Uncharacterized protein n=1 Tax=Brassica campestris TaxID=3711 RepID=M4F3S9_BRACM